VGISVAMLNLPFFRLRLYRRVGSELEVCSPAGQADGEGENTQGHNQATPQLLGVGQCAFGGDQRHPHVNR
jgi:hypothetical protein